MKQILLFGAGKSATSLIDYLIRQAGLHQFHLVVADGDYDLAKQKTADSGNATAVRADIRDAEKRNALIARADIVISLLPPALHALVAESCLAAGRHLLTASYADEKMKQLEPAIREKGLLFLCEMGLDPGIDHMSAMQMIHLLKNRGATITSFHSYCGGLVAPESDNNPWHYKISWNPRNVVMAGKTGAVYKQSGQIVEVSYQHLFDPNRVVDIPGQGVFSWYPNRDSLDYIPLYGLEDTPTFIRATLRHPDYCRGWKKVVALNLTDDVHKYDTNNMSIGSFFSQHLAFHLKEAEHAQLSQAEKTLLAFLGLYSQEKLNQGDCTAADLLQKLMETRLKLQAEDKDMIVMLHHIGYMCEGQKQETTATLVVKGQNATHTAMAKTVGLPLGIAAIMILRGKIHLKGLHIPVVPDIYEPVLEALGEEGIAFHHHNG